jgi:D-glycero-D-manno-heptose 1,7-bisphosphate phosphatase
VSLDTVFLDRDGTINVKAPEGEYVTAPESLRLLPGAAAAIRRLNDADVRTVLVTNQRGVALGRMSAADLDAVHAELARALDAEAGARLDLVLHCPHDEGACDCRKPLPGLVHQAVERVPAIDLARSAFVGDSWRDAGAAQAAGIPCVLLGEDAPDLAAAVDRLLASGS